MLVAVPLEDQLRDPSSMGLPDGNPNANCVPTTLAAAGKALVGWRYSGGDLCDLVYGEAHRGATDPLAFRPFLAQHGITMTEVRSPDGNALVATVKAELAKGHPVYGAIASMWGLYTGAQVNTQGLPSHAIMFCDAAGGTLTAMNPWPVDGQNAFYQRMSEAWWASRLCYSHVIILSRSLPVSLHRQSDGGVTDDHGHVLRLSMADYALAHHASADVLHEEDYSLQNVDEAHFHSFATLSDGSTLTYQRQENATREDRSAFVIAALLGRESASNAASAQQINALKAQLAAAQQENATTPVGEMRALLQEYLGKLPPAA